MTDFKSIKSFSERSSLSSKLRAAHPDRYPIIFQRKSTHDPELSQVKYLVPGFITLASLYSKVLPNIKFHSPNDTLIFFINGSMLNNSSLISSIYDNYSNDDGFLYITYATESTFG